MFKISCVKGCGWNKTIYTSKDVETVTRGRKGFDINTRSVLAFREIGKAHTAVQTLCGYMNMPPPMSVTTYNDIINSIHNNYMEVANKSMQDDAQEIRQQELKDEYSEDAIVNIDISADGTWQRCGYAPLNGAVTIIGINNGKCLAFEALSKVCKACQTWESLKGSDPYEEFMQTHKCPINHEFSAGSMEASGVL